MEVASDLDATFSLKSDSSKSQVQFVRIEPTSFPKSLLPAPAPTRDTRVLQVIYKPTGQRPAALRRAAWMFSLRGRSERSLVFFSLLGAGDRSGPFAPLN